jgi:hypothetical protein
MNLRAANPWRIVPNHQIAGWSMPATRTTGTRCGAGTCYSPLHRQDIAKGVAKTREHAGLLRAQAMRAATGALRGADGAVHQHPDRAFGIAAGVALLPGFLAARR